MSYKWSRRDSRSTRWQVQRRRNREVPVDGFDESLSPFLQPDPCRPCTECGEKPQQISLHIHEQAGKREPVHHDVGPRQPALLAAGTAVLPHAQLFTDELDLRSRVMAKPRRFTGDCLDPVSPVLQPRAAARHHRRPGDRVDQSQATRRDEELLGEKCVHDLVTPAWSSNIQRASQRGYEESNLLVVAIGSECQPRPRRHRRDRPRWRPLRVEERNLHDGLHSDHHTIQADPR